jgi:hypothetical protein
VHVTQPGLSPTAPDARGMKKFEHEWIPDAFDEHPTFF